MYSKKCGNCGNDNDALLTNCLFCKSSLPVIDLQSISNEELIMNAGQWIGKLKVGQYRIVSNTANEWTGRGINVINKSQIQGYALQYLSLIQVRAISNINLNAVYQDLKTQYDIGVAADDVIERARKNLAKGGKQYFVFMIILGIVTAVLMFFLDKK